MRGGPMRGGLVRTGLALPRPRLAFWRRRDDRDHRGGLDPSGSGGPGSKVSATDLLDEAVAGLAARPGRLVLTVFGVVIGLAALVATIGLARTAGNRIVGRFDALAATEIVVSGRPAATGSTANAPPWDAPARLERLNGVVAAGNVSTVDVGGALISATSVRDPRTQTEFTLAIQAASPGLFAAIRAEVAAGRVFDAGHSQRADRVAVLGPAAADRLGIARVDQLPAIRIGDDIYLVIGILEGVGRQPNLLGAVLIPEGTARAEYRLAAPELTVVETAIGATPLISQQIPLALRPDNPRALRIASPPEPARVRDNVQNDLNALFLILGGVSLLVGAIGIANVTLVSVMERTSEIGLRRALGATQTHIALQFLIESSAMGVFGGILGASVGVLTVVGVAAAQSWTPVLDPLLPVASPVIGGVIGLVSGAYPAIRAARMEPVEALRTAT